MRRLDQRYRQRRANGPERWNLPELGGDGVFPTLRQQIAPRLLSQMLQPVRLLVEVFGPTVHAGLSDLSQPLEAMMGSIDRGARTRNGPTAIQRFDPAHRASEVIDRSELVGA